MSTKPFEHALYIGGYMAGMIEGAQIVLYVDMIHRLVQKSRAHGALRRSDVFFLSWSTMLCVLVAFCNAANAIWGEFMWISDRDKPGGIPEFIATETTVWYQDLGTTASVVLLLMNDALMIWRCFIVWESNLWIIAGPLFIYIASLPLAIVELVSSFEPTDSVFTGKALKFGTSYYAVTITLNVALTALICGRLLAHSRYLRQHTALGPGSTEVYDRIIAILVEAAVPYTLLGIAFLVPYALSSPISIALGEVWGSIVGLSQQMIILRVVTRKSWERTLATHAPTSVVFAPVGGATSMSSNTAKATASTNDSTAYDTSTSRVWASAEEPKIDPAEEV